MKATEDELHDTVTLQAASGIGVVVAILLAVVAFAVYITLLIAFGSSVSSVPLRWLIVVFGLLFLIPIAVALGLYAHRYDIDIDFTAGTFLVHKIVFWRERSRRSYQIADLISATVESHAEGGDLLRLEFMDGKCFDLDPTTKHNAEELLDRVMAVKG